MAPNTEISNSSSEDKQVEREAAQAALSMVQQQKKAVVKHVRIPWWQGPLIGLCMAILVVTHAAPTPFNLLLVGLACLGIFFTLRFYSTQPVLVSGWRTGKTRVLSVLFFVIYLAHYFGSMWLFSHGHNWILPVSAASIFVVAIIYGRVWLTLWRKEMEVRDVS